MLINYIFAPVSETTTYILKNGIKGTLKELEEIFDGYDFKDFMHFFIELMDADTKEHFRTYAKKRMFLHNSISPALMLAKDVNLEGKKYHLSVLDGDCQVTKKHCECICIEIEDNDTYPIYISIGLIVDHFIKNGKIGK